MKKIVWSVVALVVIGLVIFATPVYKLAVIKIAEYQWQKFTEKSLMRTKQIFSANTIVPYDPKNVMGILRTQTFQQSLKPAFSESRAWEVLYCAYTLPHWDYYKVNRRVFEKPLLKMREAIMSSAKSYFADTTNLYNFYKKSYTEIIDFYVSLDSKSQSEFVNVVNLTIAVFENVLNDVALDSTDYYETYLEEYAKRRLVEGGKPLVKCYRDIALDIRSKVENSTKKEMLISKN